jgi:hypothetical protein
MCFNRCSSLRAIIFESPSKLARLETNVFVGGNALHAISIPASVMVIGKSCFGDGSASTPFSHRTWLGLSRSPQHRDIVSAVPPNSAHCQDFFRVPD